MIGASELPTNKGSGFDATDALLLYLLWRNPPGFGYGAPPIIVSNPGGFSSSTSGTSSTSGYRGRSAANHLA